MRPILLVAWLGLAVGCSADADGDGLTNGQEKELGTDPENPDTDSDTLSDSVEVYDLSTDPLLADTDCDGFDDPEEVDLFSNPLEPLDYPGLRTRWPDLQCHAPTEGLGFEGGKVVPNVWMVDQFGQEVHLHQFYGHVVLIDMSAGWCAPCRSWAEAAQPIYDKFRDDGFTIIHAMTDDYTDDDVFSDDFFLETWADEYGLTFPVTHDESVLYDGFRDAGHNPDKAIPFLALLDRGHHLSKTWVGYSDEMPPVVSEAIRKAVQEAPPWE